MLAFKPTDRPSPDDLLPRVRARLEELDVSTAERTVESSEPPPPRREKLQKSLRQKTLSLEEARRRMVAKMKSLFDALSLEH